MIRFLEFMVNGCKMIKTIIEKVINLSWNKILIGFSLAIILLAVALSIRNSYNKPLRDFEVKKLIEENLGLPFSCISYRLDNRKLADLVIDKVDGYVINKEGNKLKVRFTLRFINIDGGVKTDGGLKSAGLYFYRFKEFENYVEEEYIDVNEWVRFTSEMNFLRFENGWLVGDNYNKEEHRRVQEIFYEYSKTNGYFINK